MKAEFTFMLKSSLKVQSQLSADIWILQALVISFKHFGQKSKGFHLVRYPHISGVPCV